MLQRSTSPSPSLGSVPSQQSSAKKVGGCWGCSAASPCALDIQYSTGICSIYLCEVYGIELAQIGTEADVFLVAEPTKIEVSACECQGLVLTRSSRL